MIAKRSCTRIFPVLLAACFTACAGTKSATALDIAALRSQPMAADVGYTNGVGVPSLAERVAARPGLKFAIVQVAYGIQGRPEMTFTTDIFQFGGVTSWKQTTTPEIMLPASLALSAASNAAKSLERALTEQGFDVIPHEQIAQTKAYGKHYKDYPRGYHIKEGMLGGFTIVGAPPMGVYQIDNIFQLGNLHQVWPDAQALKDIKDELGQDTLMLCLRFEAQTFQGGSSNLKCNSILNVADPDYAGYGIGGYGHLVTAIDAHTDRVGAEVPGFLARDGKLWQVDWTPVFQDLSRVHKAFADGMAGELKRMAYPPAESP